MLVVKKGKRYNQNVILVTNMGPGSVYFEDQYGTQVELKPNLTACYNISLMPYIEEDLNVTNTIGPSAF